ncbi:MAG: DUF748 domain-containing protein, partial [Bacteroidota bacterium]
MSPREPSERSPRSAPDRPAHRLWRRLAVVAGIALGIASLFAALLLIAPRHVARYVANHYLQGMQIDVEGVSTIDVDLPEGEVRMGPVRFHAGTADPGTIGRLGVKLSLRNLLEKQALLESVVIEDVAISIRQNDDGQLLINGVPLRQFLAERAAAQEQMPESAEQEKQGRSSWGAGVDNLHARNVHLHFINRYGGTADLDLEQLDLRGFRSWEPDRPGVFVLTANVNGVEVNAYGTARPFAEKIAAQVTIGVDGAGLQNIEQYTGPFNFKRADGTVTVYARNDLKLFPDGRLNGTTDATMVFGNVDVADPARGELKFDQCGITADARYGIDAAGVTTVDGKAGVKLNQADARSANGIGMALRFATLDLADLSATPPGDGVVRLKTTAKASAESGNLSVGGGSPGATPVAVDFAGISSQATDLTLTSSADGMRLGAKATADAQQLAVRLSPPGGGEARRMASETFRIELPSMSLETAGGVSSIKGAGTGRLAKVSVALPATGDQPRVGLTADGAQLDFTDLKLNSGGNGETRLDGTVQAALTGLAGSWGAATVGPVEQPRRGRTRGKPAEAAAPSAAGRIAANDLALGLAPLRLRATGDGVTAGGLASTTVTGLSANVPAGPGAAPYEIAAARLRVELADLDLASRGAESTLSAKVDATSDDLVATQSASPSTASARGGDQTRLAIASLRLALSPLHLGARADQLSLSAAGSTALDRLTAALPKTATKPAFDVNVGGVRANLAEIGAELAPGGAHWRARLDAQLADIASLVDGGKLASSKVRTISIGDARADDRLRFVVDRLVLAKPEASLTREYVAATAVTEESRPKEAVKEAEQAARQGATFAMNSFSVADGGTLRYRDASVTPNANFILDVKGLQVLNLDTGDPRQQTQIRMDATINQYTEVTVNGWAAPFGKAPDFNLTASVRRLELPPLSPYAARAIGLNLESGRLSIDASAAADTGKLNGAFDVTLRDLGFSPLSKAEAERLSASVGVPIETLVGLLQDDQGRIQLKLPVSGDLQNPNFDFGDAIRQTLAGAVQAAVLAPFQLAFAPVALIARAAGAGDAGMTFNPIPFDPGKADLTSTGQDMAAALARVLQERDKLKLRVCGRATAQDLAAALGGAPPAGPERDQAVEKLGGKLEALASERTAAVRRVLIEQSGAKPWQVGECRSAFDPADTGPPRVEIS